MNKASRTYIIEFGGAMALYVVTLLISVNLVQGMGPSPLRILLAAAPIVPVTLALLAFLRFFRHMDELQKRIQLDAMAFALGATGLLTFTYGLLENAGLPQLSFVWVLPLMVALWGIGTVAAARRYQ